LLAAAALEVLSANEYSKGASYDGYTEKNKPNGSTNSKEFAATKRALDKFFFKKIQK